MFNKSYCHVRADLQCSVKQTFVSRPCDGHMSLLLSVQNAATAANLSILTHYLIIQLTGFYAVLLLGFFNFKIKLLVSLIESLNITG